LLIALYIAVAFAVTDPLAFHTAEDLQPPVLIEEPFRPKTEALILTETTSPQRHAHTSERTHTHPHAHAHAHGHSHFHGQATEAPSLSSDEEALFRKFETRRHEEKLKRKIDKKLYCQDFSASHTSPTPSHTPTTATIQHSDISPEEKILFDKYIAYHLRHKEEAKRAHTAEELARKEARFAENQKTAGQCPWAHAFAAREREALKVEQALEERNTAHSCGCPHARKARHAKVDQQAEEEQETQSGKQEKSAKKEKSSKKGKKDKKKDKKKKKKK